MIYRRRTCEKVLQRIAGLLVLDIMSGKRQHSRYLMKLPVEIGSGEYVLSGITVRVSRRGLFVRSQKSFSVGTPVEMVLHLTDMISCKLRGIVKYARSFVEFRRQNGMGIEFTEMDQRYLDFISAVESEKARPRDCC
jgi:Tfp pilus assembly protein PilZ